MKFVFTNEEYKEFESSEEFRNKIYGQCVEKFNNGIKSVSFYVDKSKKPFIEDLYPSSPEIIKRKTQ